MKRKIVVTMSLAWWTDDKYWEEPVNSNEDAIALLERDCKEADYIDFAEECNTIKIEITETEE